MSKPYVVIMAGGVGTRFWPLSSHSNPKQTRKIISQKSLLESTIERAKNLVPNEQILIVTGHSMLQQVQEIAKQLPAENIIIEESAKNTAPCIALAMKHIQTKQGTSMVVWPSDHHIEDCEYWMTVHRKGLEMIASQGLVLIGISPTYPATGYGYIQSKHGRVQAFHEKPDVEKARYLIQHHALWNAGVCIVNINTLEQLFHQHLPACLDKQWSDQPSISFDYAILEKATDIQVLSYDGGWSDLGDWDSVAEHLPRVESHQVHPNVAFIGVESQRCVVVSHRPSQVSIVGLDDIIVVQGTEGLLIMKRGMAQKVRHIQKKS